MRAMVSRTRRLTSDSIPICWSSSRLPGNELPQKSAKKANKKELVGEDGLAAKTCRAVGLAEVEGAKSAKEKRGWEPDLAPGGEPLCSVAALSVSSRRLPGR